MVMTLIPSRLATFLDFKYPRRQPCPERTPPGKISGQVGGLPTSRRGSEVSRSDRPVALSHCQNWTYGEGAPAIAGGTCDNPGQNGSPLKPASQAGFDHERTEQSGEDCRNYARRTTRWRSRCPTAARYPTRRTWSRTLPNPRWWPPWTTRQLGPCMTWAEHLLGTYVPWIGSSNDPGSQDRTANRPRLTGNRATFRVLQPTQCPRGHRVPHPEIPDRAVA